MFSFGIFGFLKFVEFVEFFEFLELGDNVSSFEILIFLEFLEFLDFWEFVALLELGDRVFSVGFFAIVKCCCVLWGLYCLKRIWKHEAPAQFSEQFQICHT